MEMLRTRIGNGLPSVPLLLAACFSFSVTVGATPSIDVQLVELEQQRIAADRRHPKERYAVYRGALAPALRAAVDQIVAAPSRAPDPLLRRAFDALRQVVVWSPELAPSMQALYAELGRRGMLEQPRDARSLAMALIEHRDVAAARAVLATAGIDGAIVVPAIEDTGIPPGARSLLVAGGERDILRREPTDLPASGAILVVHPQCSPSNRALEALRATPDLAAWLARNALLVIPPSASLTPEAQRGFQRAHSDLRIGQAYAVDDWPEVDEWRTPGFYFLRDGRLVEVFHGWPPAGNEARFRAGLARTSRLGAPAN